MAGKQAKTLSAQELDMLLEHVRGRRDYLRSRVIVLLSFRAGLRAAEICGLDWPMILDASGKVAKASYKVRETYTEQGRKVQIVAYEIATVELRGGEPAITAMDVDAVAMTIDDRRIF